MPLSGKFAKDAETFCSASATLDHFSGRLQPSQGGRRTLWWNGRGEDTTATPPQKKHNDKAATGRGMAPSSHGRVCLNGIDSIFYVHLRPSASPCITTSFRRRRRRPRKSRRVHPKWPLPGLSWSPGTVYVHIIDAAMIMFENYIQLGLCLGSRSCSAEKL